MHEMPSTNFYGERRNMGKQNSKLLRHGLGERSASAGHERGRGAQECTKRRLDATISVTDYVGIKQSGERSRGS